MSHRGKVWFSPAPEGLPHPHTVSCGHGIRKPGVWLRGQEKTHPAYQRLGEAAGMATGPASRPSWCLPWPPFPGAPEKQRGCTGRRTLTTQRVLLLPRCLGESRNQTGASVGNSGSWHGLFKCPPPPSALFPNPSPYPMSPNPTGHPARQADPENKGSNEASVWFTVGEETKAVGQAETCPRALGRVGTERQHCKPRAGARSWERLPVTPVSPQAPSCARAQRRGACSGCQQPPLGTTATPRSCPRK